MQLLDHFTNRWQRASGTFSQKRTAQQVGQLLLGLLAAYGRRTIANALVYLGQAYRDWTGRYRHFERSDWEADEIFKVAFTDVVKQLADHPFIPVSLDDTMLPTTSIKRGLATYGRDPASPKFHVNLRRGLRFVHAAIVLPKYQPHMRPLAISVGFDLAPPLKKPGKNASKKTLALWKTERKKHTLSAVGLRVYKRMRTWLDKQGLQNKRLHGIVDGSYINKIMLRGLPERTDLTGRCRKDIALYLPGATPCRYGERAQTPEEVRQDDTIAWQRCSCHYAGEQRAIDYKVTEERRWKAAGCGVPLRLIVIRPIPYTGPGNRRAYRKPAYLLTTDLTTPPEILIQAYLDRWQIEVLHRDLKTESGLGAAAVFVPKATKRLHSAIVAANALLNLAAQDYCQGKRPSELPPLPKWRRVRSNRRASQQELIALLRIEMADSGMIDASTEKKQAPRSPPSSILLAQAS